MPTYEYICQPCQKKIESFQKISDPPLVECPHCRQPTLKRGPGGGVGLLFKSKGFYCTDYASPHKEESCCPCGKEKSRCSTSAPPKSGNE